jgi:hypothetical protein
MRDSDEVRFVKYQKAVKEYLEKNDPITPEEEQIGIEALRRHDFMLPCRLTYHNIPRERANAVLECLAEKGVAQRVVRVNVLYRLTQRVQEQSISKRRIFIQT